MAKQPNILILMTDQQRADCLGAAGHPVLKTPNLDCVADEGVRFENAVTTCPLSMPARVSFVTGLYCHNHTMWNNAGELAAGEETFFHHLQRAGYRTGYVGKSHFYNPRKGQDMRDREPYMRGLGIEYVHEVPGPHFVAISRSHLTDHWERLGLYDVYKEGHARSKQFRNDACPSRLPEDEHLDSYVGRIGAGYIEGAEADRPWCLFVSFGGPHEPFDAPGRYATMYDPASCPSAIPPEPIPDNLPSGARAYVGSRRDFLKDGEPIRPEQIARARANYYGKISLIDDGVGRMLAALEARGQLQDTLIVFWSDHGEMIGDHGRFHKSCFYEPSVRIPLLLRWPGQVPAGQVRGQPVESIDVFDTLLAAAGCEPSRRSMGRSLLPAARDGSAAHRDAAFSEIKFGLGQGAARTTMCRTDRWKYAVDQSREPLILFDLPADPDEQRNLAGDAGLANVRTQLDRRILKWLLETQLSL